MQIFRKNANIRKLLYIERTQLYMEITIIYREHNIYREYTIIYRKNTIIQKEYNYTEITQLYRVKINIERTHFDKILNNSQKILISLNISSQKTIKSDKVNLPGFLYQTIWPVKIKTVESRLFVSKYLTPLIGNRLHKEH